MCYIWYSSVGCIPHSSFPLSTTGRGGSGGGGGSRVGGAGAAAAASAGGGGGGAGGGGAAGWRDQSSRLIKSASMSATASMLGRMARSVERQRRSDSQTCPQESCTEGVS